MKGCFIMAIVKWHNNFIEAVYKLNLIPKKLLIGIAYKLQKIDAFEEQIELNAKEICDTVGILPDSYRLLETAVDCLMKTVITVKDRYDKKTFIKFQLLGESSYKNGVLKINAPKNLRLFLREINETYTKYKLENIQPLNSEYSIRIFELLKKNAFRGEFVETIDELKKKFDIKEKYKL
jgi:plasmid replication initiation protein